MKVVEPGTLFGDDVPLNTESGEPHVRCPIHEEGQEFYVHHNYNKPEVYCPGASRAGLSLNPHRFRIHLS